MTILSKTRIIDKRNNYPTAVIYKAMANLAYIRVIYKSMLTIRQINHIHGEI